MFRPSRRRSDGEDALLFWRVRLFALAAALALAGIAFDSSWVVWVGIAVLGVGAVVRFLGPRDRADG